jgi:hypothetical protein
MSATGPVAGKKRRGPTPEPTGEWSPTRNVFSPGGEKGEYGKAPV